MDPTGNVNNLEILSSVNLATRDNLANVTSSTNSILSEQFAQNVSTMAGNEAFNISLDNTVHTNALATQSAIERNGIANVDSTYQTSADVSIAIERNALSEIDAIERLSGEIESSVEKHAKGTLAVKERVASETRRILSENNTAAALLGKDILLDTKEQKSEVGLQASHYFNKTEVKLQQVEGELKLGAIEDTNSINLESVRTKAELQADSSTYCCELKTLINSTAYSTNEINRKIEYTRMRDELNNATTEHLFRNLMG